MKPVCFPSIEPLEARIAPALLVTGANLLGGAGNPTVGEGATGDTSVAIVKVLSGQAVVWFDGYSVVGISFGPNTTLDISGSVDGDIVGNLGANGRLSDSDHNPLNGEDGNVLLPNNLLGLTVHPFGADPGGVFSVKGGGSIITGGTVANVDVNYTLGGVYAGDGVFHADSAYNSAGTVVVDVGSDLDVNPVQPGVQTNFTFTTAIQTDASNAPLKTGASVKNVSMGIAFQLQIISGSGKPPGVAASGIGGSGGNVENVTIETATVPSGAPSTAFSYQLIAGNGASDARGGAGGSIIKIIEKTSGGKAELRAGDGGNGSAGPGGAGGSILSLDLQSNSVAYTVSAGDGGNGTPGGAGGNVENTSFANRTANSGLVFTGEFTGDAYTDVVIVDGGTGRIVVEQQAADGTFSRVVQYVKPVTFEPIDIVDAQGSLPSDGAVADVDNDGDLDLVVAYKASNSVVVFFNDGFGSFYDKTNPLSPKVNSKQSALVGSPNAIDIDPTNPTRIVAVGVGEVGGKTVGTLELLSLQIDQTSGDLSLTKVGLENTFSSELSDVALTRLDSGFTGAIFSLKNGTLSTATFAQQQDGDPTPAFVPGTSFAQIAGGVRRIDISSDGTTLAVLGPNSFGIGIYDTTVATPTLKGNLPPTGGGNPSVMRFVDDGLPNTPDNLFVLSNGAGSSRLSIFAADGAAQTGYSLSRTFDSAEVFRNFAGFGTTASPGFAAVTSALNTFTFSSDFAITTQSTLPFSGKSIILSAGNGGNGLDLVNNFGAGGAGGSILSINAEAVEISLTAGHGGNTQKGPGGAGGSLSNPATFIPASGGGSVAPRIVAEDALTLVAGDGGSPTIGSTVASGGNGGSLRGLNVELISGDVNLIGGTGGDSRGAKAGAGGSLTSIVSLARDGNLLAQGGAGGNALDTAGAAGAGGSITTFSHTLLLDADVESQHRAYDVILSGGNGGSAAGTALTSVGGAGGSLTGITLDLDNSDVDIDNLNGAGKDGLTNPVTITLTGGKGGNGAVGGTGGSIATLSYTSHHDQFPGEGSIFIGYFTMSIEAGDGGNGVTGAGGAGGSFTGSTPLSGLTGFDPDGPASSNQPLRVVAGDGGDGKTAGGAGGSVRNLQSRNALAANGGNITGNHLTGAEITAGDGGNASAGNGGVGGTITGTSIGVSSRGVAGTDTTGRGLFAHAGAGGSGAGTATAKGGAGGAITGGVYGSLDAFGSGIVYELAAGDGGAGAAAGGTGGTLSGVTVNIHQQTDSLGGVSILSAGDGGAATAALGKGGKGGSVTKVSQLKDLNSIITAIYAGNGGDAASGVGGLGGSVTSVKTAGFIGQPSDSSSGGTDRYGVFHPSGIPQGLFVGRGGAGATAGKAGSVSSVSARQIAAIAAISATSGLFVAAEKVSGVKADVIGYDANGNNLFDGATADPQTGMPVDGFILSKVITGVTGTHTGFVFDV